MKTNFFFSGRNLYAALVSVILVAILASCEAGEVIKNVGLAVRCLKPVVQVDKIEKTSLINLTTKDSISWTADFSDGNSGIINISGNLRVKKLWISDIIETQETRSEKGEEKVNVHVEVRALDQNNKQLDNYFEYAKIKLADPTTIVVRDTVVLRDTVVITPDPGVVKAFLVADTAMNYRRNADKLSAEMRHRLVKVEIWNNGDETHDTIWNKSFQVAEASLASLSGKIYSKNAASALSYSSNVNWLQTTEKTDGAFALTTRNGEVVYNAAYSNVDGKSENWTGKNSIMESDVTVAYEEYNAEYSFNLANTFAGQSEANRSVADENQYSYNGTSVANFSVALNGANLGSQIISLDVFKPIEKVDPTIVRTYFVADTTMNYKFTESSRKWLIKMNHHLEKVTVWSDGREDKAEIWDKTIQIGKCFLQTREGRIYSNTPAAELSYSSNMTWGERENSTDNGVTSSKRFGEFWMRADYICDANNPLYFEASDTFEEANVTLSYEDYNATYNFSFTTEFLGQKEEKRSVSDEERSNHVYRYEATSIATWRARFNGVNLGTMSSEVEVMRY